MSVDETSASDGERVLQIGEGRFLRGFVDWILEQLARRGVYRSRVVVVFPRPHEVDAKTPWMQSQGRFHVVIRGFNQGHIVDTVDAVSVVSRVLDPYREWDAFLRTAENPAMELLITNTTEAGLTWFEEPYSGREKCPQSVGGKLTAWLWERYQAFDGSTAAGVNLLPCELVEQNGEWLRTLIQRYARAWGLPEEFCEWIVAANRFYNTLVDSIITPVDSDDERVRGDSLAVTREPFYRWILEGPPDLRLRWHLPQPGLAVEVVPDLRPHRELKVRILNGAHTAVAALGLLAGLHTVGEVMADAMFREFLNALLIQEVAPTLDSWNLDRAAVRDFIDRVLERFQNPYLHHRLQDIQLQAVTKVRTRLLTSLRDRWLATHRVPPRLALAVVAQAVWLARQEGVTALTEDHMLWQMQQWWDEAWLSDREWHAAARVWLSPLLRAEDPVSIQALLKQAL
ncbi:MAG: tagaturonate reductase [Firmicutes bacterium]|nr:tagaturonate reductase [Bacillota bacterium]